MFNIDNSVNSQSSTKNQLKGNEIHDVTFVGAVATELKDGEYKVVQLKFENALGEFVDTIFEPGAEDGQRKPNTFGGENPSGLEELQAKVRHAIAALNPELDKKIESGTQPLKAANWESLRKLIVASLKKGEGKKVQIKLLSFPGKDKNGNPVVNVRFPGYVLGISKDGNLYMRTNYIGENLQFTPKEKEKINTVETAKPTNMGSSNDLDLGTDYDSGKKDEDLDFDIESL